MKKISTIFLLVMLVCIQTPAGQVFKIPLLIEHLMKHQEENGISLVDFLKEHYNPGHHDADLPEDEQLPFKSMIHYNIGYAIIPGLIKSTQVIFLQLKKNTPPYTGDVPQQHLVRIFHPPRI